MTDAEIADRWNRVDLSTLVRGLKAGTVRLELREPDNIADDLQARATEEWLRDLLNPRPWALMTYEEFVQLAAREAADAAKGLRITAETASRTNAPVKADTFTWEAA